MCTTHKAILALTALASLVFALPTTTLQPRQIGFEPGECGDACGWSPEWTHPTTKAPTAFDSTSGANCSYEVTFKRDIADDEYFLSYEAGYGAGETRAAERKVPSVLEYRGDVDEEGRRTYYAFIEDGCREVFRPDEVRPERMRIYFTRGVNTPMNYVATFWA